VDVTRPAILARLLWAARRVAARRITAGWGEQSDDDAAGWPDRHRPGHPDLVLVDAVALGVLSSTDARLVAATRLERTSDAVVAAALGMPVGVLRSRRHRAVRRLAQAITSGAL
jgi:DNA-directed RNA polymerase specialized sigma24 family protein